MTFKIKTTAVEISFWFAAVITFLLLFMGDSSAVCFVLCVLHEVGHLTAMLIFGSIPKKIELGFFGMKIVTGSRILSPIKEIVIAAAGPCVNIVLCLILYLSDKTQWAMLSLGLAVFNLLPVPMLDGGRILINATDNERLIKNIGVGVSVFLLIVGTAVAVMTKKNFTILIVSLYLLTGTVAVRNYE